MEETTKTMLFLAFFALFVVTMMFLVISQAVRRRKTMAALAKELGFVYQQEDRALLEQFEGFSILRAGSNRRCVNVVRGKAGRVKVWLFDYSFFSGGGSKSSRSEYSVCALRSQDLALPGFTLRAEIPGVDRLGDLLVKKGLAGQKNLIAASLGAGDIDFAEDEPFSRKFVLQGEEHEVRPLFTGEIRRYLLSFTPPVSSIEGRGDTLLLLYWYPLSPKSAGAFIGQATELGRLLGKSDIGAAGESSV